MHVHQLTFGNEFAKKIEFRERIVLLNMMIQSIYKCKEMIKIHRINHPIEYSFPVEEAGKETDSVCRVTAKFKISDRDILTLHLDFVVYSIFNQKVSDLNYRFADIKMEMNEQALSWYFEHIVQAEQIPLHRGVFSFNELPQIIQAFILPTFSATYLTEVPPDHSKSSSQGKTVLIESRGIQRTLLSITIELGPDRWLIAQ